MQQLKGIIPPMVTPLTDQDTLDTLGLERLIDHILAGGVDGLFVLGSSGEAASLCTSLSKKLIEAAIRHVAGRVPVLVGITDTCLGDCLTKAFYAADQGAQAVVMAAPYYFPISQDDLLRFTEKVAKASPLPVFIYNMPSCTKVAYEIQTLQRLAEMPNICGIKDSSGDMHYFHRLIDLTAVRPDWSVLIGPEELLAEAVMMGGHGGVCGGANIFPELYKALYDAAARGAVEQTQKLHRFVIELSKVIYNGGYLPGVKYALEHLGICSGYAAEPLRGPSANQQRKIIEFVDAFEWNQDNHHELKSLRKIKMR